MIANQSASFISIYLKRISPKLGERECICIGNFLDINQI